MSTIQALSRFQTTQTDNSRSTTLPKGKVFPAGFQWNLGIPFLLPEWKTLFRAKDLKGDLVAGLVVACAAVPLSLAIALASGVSPATGLITAIVAGITCALFGGTPLAVSGPAAAMAVLVSTAVSKHGLSGLLVVTLICGTLQLLSGASRLGRFIRFVPTPVVMGFTAGIGAIIFMGQLPRALGLPAPDPSHICDVITHTGELLRQLKFAPFALALSTVSVMLALPKLLPKVPAALVAVVLPSIFAAFLGLNVETIGQIPNSLPMPKFPAFPEGSVWELLLTGLTVYALASLETLLSSSAVDKLSRGKAHESDQELIGQGLGNIASAFFGGIPATGVIARSALNVQAGAKTRRAAIIHSLVLIATVFFMSPIISRIPISVLAGILLAVALRMLNPKELIGLWNTSKGDAIIYVVTFLVIVSVGLLAGIQAGIAAALLVAAVRLSQIQITAHAQDHEGPLRVSLSGPLTFLSSAHLANLKKQLDERKQQSFLFDFSRVTIVDSSGAEQFGALVSQLKQKGAKLAILNASKQLQQMVQHDAFSDSFVTTEAEAQAFFADQRPIHRLLHGVDLFRSRSREKYEPLFGKLADSQSPHTLLVTCSDSRIDPGLITSTYPGELFVVRNVGNLVPKYGSDKQTSEQAALEYAISVLNVKELIVCGHSGCGAVQAMLNGIPLGLPGVNKWLTMTMGDNFLRMDNVDDSSKANVLQQVENLLSYSVVREKVEKGELRIHAWFYEIKSGNVLSWDKGAASFVSATEPKTCCVN